MSKCFDYQMSYNVNNNSINELEVLKFELSI